MEQQRLDQWLWYARFFKSRTLAATIVKSKKVRVDGTVVSKASTMVRVGQTLTFAKDQRVRIIEITAIGTRRGPATEAATLYRDLTPERTSDNKKDITIQTAPTATRDRGAGRPTKKERREIDKLMDN